MTDEFSRRDIEFHRETAASYDDDVTREYAVYHERLLWPFLERVAAERSGARALDLGCGTGVVTLALAARGFESVGVDHSEEMLQLARRKAGDAGVHGLTTFETADVRALRFDDGEFECVTCQGLLHHLESIEPCLSELERVLSPGGFFFLSEPAGDETPVKRMLRGVWRVLPHRARRDLREEAPETVEVPIDPAELRGVLDGLSLEYEVEFLTHLPPLRRRLPGSLYLTVSRILTLPWRRRRGDLVFVFGKKRSG